VARLWATRKIGHLLAEIRRNGPDSELIEAITGLSLRYGVVTPYTSYLVLEPETDRRRTCRRDQPAGDAASTPTSCIHAVQPRPRTWPPRQPPVKSAVAASQARTTLQQAQTVERKFT
jgi:Ca-activated chloride channel family protein